MRNTSTGIGRVIVNRSMSLDGFIAGRGHGDLGKVSGEDYGGGWSGAVTILRFRVRK